MKTNVVPAPKAPAVSPTTAALLSVCFKLAPRLHYYCSRPMVRRIRQRLEVHTY
jgi:hypothetical protein